MYCGCAGWSAPLSFACDKVRYSRVGSQIILLSDIDQLVIQILGLCQVYFSFAFFLGRTY